jgi:hypothetical protein
VQISKEERLVGRHGLDDAPDERRASAFATDSANELVNGR